MKAALGLFIALSLCSWCPAGEVPAATIRALGLSGVRIATDREGEAVRGRLTFSSSVRGSTLIFGQLSNGATATAGTSSGGLGTTTLSLSTSFGALFGSATSFGSVSP